MPLPFVPHSKITFGGYIFDIGARDIQELTFFLESSPPIEVLKKYISERYGDVKISKLDAPTITPTTQTHFVKAKEVEWVKRPTPKPFVFPTLPSLDK
jgi:secreted Zn-dependent insulinase-like peptidase